MMQRLADSPQVSRVGTAAGALLQQSGGTGLLPWGHFSGGDLPGWHPLSAALLSCPLLLSLQVVTLHGACVVGQQLVVVMELLEVRLTYGCTAAWRWWRVLRGCAQTS